MVRITLGAGLVLLCSGCATILGGGTTQPLSVNSATPSASYEVRNAEGTTISRGATPGSITLQRKDKYVVELSADGYQDEIIPLNREVNGWFWANIVIGGIPGWIIDAITGGMYKQMPDAVNVELVTADDGALYAVVGSQRIRLTPQR